MNTMSSVTSQATKNLEQGANASVPKTEFSSGANELGSKPMEVRWEIDTAVIR